MKDLVGAHNYTPCQAASERFFTPTEVQNKIETGS